MRPVESCHMCTTKRAVRVNLQCGCSVRLWWEPLMSTVSPSHEPDTKGVLLSVVHPPIWTCFSSRTAHFDAYSHLAFTEAGEAHLLQHKRASEGRIRLFLGLWGTDRHSVAVMVGVRCWNPTQKCFWRSPPEAHCGAENIPIERERAVLDPLHIHPDTASSLWGDMPQALDMGL